MPWQPGYPIDVTFSTLLDLYWAYEIWVRVPARPK